LISQNIICFGKYCERISWKYLIQKIGFYLKIFLSFWKILVAKGAWVAKVLEKFSTQLRIELGKSFLFLFKEVLHVQLEKECVANRFYFLKPQAFFFLIKIVFHGYLRQIAKQFDVLVFTRTIVCVSFIGKRKPSFCVWVVKSFQYWHIRTSMYLTLAWLKAL